MLTSAAFTFGQGWIVWENWRRARRGEAPVQQVAKLSELPVGGSLVFHYPDEHEPCLLMRPDDKTLLAYGQKCTHLSCAVLPEIDRVVSTNSSMHDDASTHPLSPSIIPRA